MKNFVIALMMIFLTISSYGQKLSGRYSLSSKQGEEKIIVFEGGQFTLKDTKDKVASRTGFFHADTKKLELTYLIDTTKKSEYNIETIRTVNNPGNVEIAIYGDAEPFKGALIGFLQEDDKVPYRFMVDGTGNANIILSNTENLKSLTITAVGYHNIKIPVNELLNKSTKIIATMRISPMHNKKEKLVYAIKRQNEANIDLLDSNGINYTLKKIQ